MFTEQDTFFIADCHLDGSRPDVSALACEFFKAIEGAGALWIVGDFVEYWLGDDAGNPQLNHVFDAVAKLASLGTTVTVMHGNRDFLLGDAFGQRIGGTVLSDDATVTQLPQGPVSVMHGDTLCTDDVGYQQLRTLLRSSAWQTDFLGKSVAERVETAKALREKSQSATAAKTDGIMDVNAVAVEDAFLASNTRTLIHGHTHRPNTHELEINAQACRRIVLGDWHSDHARVAHSSPSGIALKTFPF